MDLDLKSDKLSYLRPVFRRRFVREETSEVIVPDALPDILRILDTEGTVCLRGKDSEEGRVSVSGVMELTVLYVPESGAGVKRLPVTLPFAASCEGEGITADSLITATVTLSGADSRTVNPRKIVVRAEVCCDAALYVTETVYNTAPRDREDVYFKTETRPLRLPVAANEKTFIFTDELHMPDAAPAIGELLRCDVTLEPESVKPVGTKAVVKGNAVSQVLYEPREGGAPRRETFTTPFSQIVETDAPGEAADFDLRLMLTGTYLTRSALEDGAGEALSLEIHAVAQCVSYMDLTAELVSDVYSTRHPLTPHLTGCEFPCLTGRDTLPETLAVSIPVAERPAAVHDVTARVTGAGLRDREGSALLVTAVNVSIIYSDQNGELLSASRRAESEHDLGPACARAQVSVSQKGECFVSARDTDVEVRVPLEITAARQETVSFERVESVELDEDTLLDLSARPSIVLTRAGQGRGLWELARDHMSTPALIREANSLEGDAEPEPGTVLLIPRR